MKNIYAVPECNVVLLNLGERLLGDQFANNSGVPVEPGTPGGSGSTGGVPGFEAKEERFTWGNLWEDFE